MPDFTHVHWLAVVIAAVASMVIGYVWYMPAVFGAKWQAETGKPMTATPMAYGMMVVSSLLMAYVLAYFLGSQDLVNGAILGAVLWLGFVATVLAGGVIWEGHSWMRWGITAGYYLVAMIAMGAIVGYFPAVM